MKIDPIGSRRKPNLLPITILVGIVLGIGLSRGIFASPMVPQQTISSDDAKILTTKLTPTVVAGQIVNIAPNLEATPNIQLGQPAPDFVLNTLEGPEITLSTLRGKTVLINVWASWCPPCRDEMPVIQAAYEKYSDKGLVVLGIDLTAQDNLEDVKAFVKDLNLTFPILLDETGDVSSELYGVIGLPTSFFIDTDGILRRIQFGAMLPDQLEKYLLEIMPRN